jgi:hypothetical protein
MRLRALVPASLLLASHLLACDGVVLDGAARPGDPGTLPTEPGPGEIAEDDPFALDRESPRLLPFETRLARVAAVAGVETSDPLLAPMRDQAISLGGYDHSRGILPDSSWSASRIAAWIRVLRPICASDEMLARYPALPAEADLDALVSAAWGRPATADDRAAITDAIRDLPPDAQRESACLAVLSAGEAVLQ